MCIVPEAKEAELAMAEAVANKATPESLVSLFTILSLHDFLTVNILTQPQFKYICDAMSAHHSHLPDPQRRDLLLTELQTSLTANGKSLQYYGMPVPLAAAKSELERERRYW